MLSFREPTHRFQTGDLVLVRRLHPRKGETPYGQPTTVLAITRTAVLTAESHQWIHASRLKKAPLRPARSDVDLPCWPYPVFAPGNGGRVCFVLAGSFIGMSIILMLVTGVYKLIEMYQPGAAGPRLFQRDLHSHLINSDSFAANSLIRMHLTAAATLNISKCWICTHSPTSSKHLPYIAQPLSLEDIVTMPNGTITSDRFNNTRTRLEIAGFSQPPILCYNKSYEIEGEIPITVCGTGRQRHCVTHMIATNPVGRIDCSKASFIYSVDLQQALRHDHPKDRESFVDKGNNSLFNQMMKLDCSDCSF
ncbi:uncharacterized protein LOC108712647 [Xenopus laevis]|uniref:Uncharacterized protein LOC108712647 n=1 Tax=Xenopus laevis TaxID=8355 RepID=A0A8J0UVN0_XENLA|nr:uncharacterized protein LOC108712647 [Xenopus laevis]